MTATQGASGRPLIGISAYREQARWGHWDLPAVLVPSDYADQVATAGGIPVLLPPVAGIEAAVTRLDGLILSGGPDIAPDRYGADAGPRTTNLRPARDAAEFALYRAATAAGLPVLAVCRGMQLVNVALGGTLVQHLPDLVGHHEHCPTPGQMGQHQVRVDPASQLGGIVGEMSVAVPTHHHQGIGELGAGLVATAWADDGTIEALEPAPIAGAGNGSVRPFTVAVQWHPEADTDPGLFAALVDAARHAAAR